MTDSDADSDSASSKGDQIFIITNDHAWLKLGSFIMEYSQRKNVESLTASGRINRASNPSVAYRSHSRCHLPFFYESCKRRISVLRMLLRGCTRRHSAIVPSIRYTYIYVYMLFVLYHSNSLVTCI